jgi:hypothetical protein
MHERLEHPDLPVRDLLVPARLVVRRSCGAQLAQNREQGTGNWEQGTPPTQS